MNAPTAAPSRYHALDALRAAMMFLGIYLHVVIAYSPLGSWPPLVKIAVALAGSVTVLLVIYRYAVRPTFVGGILNGRRYALRPAAGLALAR